MWDSVPALCQAHCLPVERGEIGYCFTRIGRSERILGRDSQDTFMQARTRQNEIKRRKFDCNLIEISLRY